MTSPTQPAPGAADQPTPEPTGTAPTRPHAPPLLPGEELSGVFGRYTVVRRLGRGGMGDVYLARDNELGRLVALKVPLLDHGDRETVRQRFYREARSAATLHHPNVCPVYDVGSVNDVPYLTMAYVEGRQLHEWVRLGPVTLADVLAVVRKIALALDEAHASGVIHRDLKPSNVMIDRRGEPVVMDFGLARQTHVSEARLTSPGVIMGTPAYLPPESIAGHDPTPAGDVYSLGVMLYELAAGRCPFVGSVTSVLARILTESPPPPSHLRPGLPPPLDAVCLKAMAKRPEDRHASMAAFAAALDAVPTSALPVPCPRVDDDVSAGPTVPPSHPLELPDAKLAPRILDMMRRWGWARAVQKMRGRSQGADDLAERRAWQAFLDWMSGGDEARASAFVALREGAALRGWSLAGQASHLLRDRDQSGALARVEKAEREGDPQDVPLQATIAHVRGAILVHRGQFDAALPPLHRALNLFGRDHFMLGRVLDTLGMAYSHKGNLPVARQFFEQSITHKRRHDDEAGIAVTHGQLGRLYLGWGELDLAETHFQEDLRLAQKLRQRYSEAQIYNHLGQVALARGVRESSANRKAAARRHLTAAAGWLDESVRLCEAGKYAVPEGYARKDRALVCLHEGDLNAADEQVRRSAALFAAEQFAEGLAKVALVEGMILRGREKFADAERKFRQTLNYFEGTQEAEEIITAYREIARTRRDAGAPAPLVTRAYAEALERAERFRHDPLVRDLEQELHEVDLEAYLRHVYRRARGQGIDEDAPSLLDAAEEIGTILFIDLPGFTGVAQGTDARNVLVTFNHLMADFAAVLGRHDASVLAYRGNGVMAIAREVRHAERAVSAALELVSALAEFNRPRELLGLPCFCVRIGIASGDLLLGNVGTYHKMDFTAIGTAVNLAGALRNEARPGVPLVSRGTYELVRERFAYAPGGPRPVTVAGLGTVDTWEVMGRA